MTEPKLEITDEYRVHFVKPGEVYPDEPTVEIPPGWYVLGAEHWDEPCSSIVIKIEEAADSTGRDVREQVAEKVAELLAAFTEPADGVA